MGIKEIIPLLSAVLGLTPIILKWINDRSSAAANRRSIQQAKEKIEFWQTWLQAQREVSTDEHYSELKNEVSKRLDEIIKSNEIFISSISNHQDTKTKRSFLQRLFLAYFPHTTAGWVYHTLFYVTISFSVFYVLGSSLPQDNIDGNPSWQVLMSNIEEVIITVIIMGLIALLFRWLANRSDKIYQKKTDLPASNNETE